MKKFPASKLLFSLLIVCGFAAVEIKANVRPPRVSKIKSCIAQKESNFSTTPTFGSGDKTANLKETGIYVSQLDELIGCVDLGLRIPNLSWRVRREWLIKKSEYYQLRQVFAQYSCYFSHTINAEVLIEKIILKVENRRRNSALRDLHLLQNSAARAKQCSDRAARFKHLDPEFKDGFREISRQTDELLEKIKELRAVVRKLPE